MTYNRCRILTLVSRFLGKREAMDFGLLLVFSVLPFVWYGSELILGSPFASMIDPFDSFIRGLYSWDSRTLLGHPNPREIAVIFPYHSFSIVFSAIGTLISPTNSLLIVDRLWLMVYFFLPAISMYYLMGVLVQNSNRVGRLMASLTYMYALPNLVNVHDMQDTWMLAYGTLPLMLGFYIRGVTTLDYVKYGSLLGLASLIMSALNPPLVIMNLLVLATYYFYDLITNRAHFLQKTKFTIFSLLLLVFLNMYVIIPALDYAMHAYISPYARSETVELMSIYSSYLERFRLLGEKGFYLGYRGVPYYSYAAQYIANPVLIFTTLLIPFVALSALIAKPRNKYVLFFGILIVLIMPMSVGTHPNNPTRSVTQWLNESIPWFWMFRNVSKFLIPLSLAFSVLTGFTANHLSQVRGQKGRILAVILACLILVNSWPAYTGHLFENVTRTNKIPEYWYEAADWLNSQHGDFRVFSLPQQYFAVYEWGHPSEDISTTLFKVPQVSISPGLSAYSPNIADLTLLAYKLVTENATGSVLSKVLGLMNVKFILQRNDVDWNFYSDVDPPERVRSILASQREIHLERQFGQLDFYLNEYVVPHIYAVNSLLCVEGGLELLPQLASSETIDFKSSAIFFSDIQSDKRDIAWSFATEVLRLLERGENVAAKNNEEILYLVNPVSTRQMPRWFDGHHYRGNFIANGSRGYISKVSVFVKNLRDSSWTWQIAFSEAPGNSEEFSVDLTVPAGAEGWFSVDVNRYWSFDSLFVCVKLNPSLLGYHEISPCSGYSSNDGGKTWVTVPCSFSIDVEYPIRVLRTVRASTFPKDITVTHRTCNPTLYSVHINASYPFVLVFSEAYDDEWNAFIGERPLEKHFLVNGYANGWIVDETGDLTIILRYVRQYPQYLGCVISIVTLVIILVTTLGYSLRKTVAHPRTLKSLTH